MGWDATGDALGGAAVAFTVMYALAALSRGSMGMGDVKVAAFCGLFLGAQNALEALLLASVAAAVVAVGLLATGKASRGDAMPLVPFLAAATILLVG